MAANWKLVYDRLTNLDGNPKPDIYLNMALTGKYLCVSCQSINTPQTWVRAGSFATFFDDSTIGKAYIRRYSCRLRHTFITLSEWELSNSFQFLPVPWLLNINIKIWSTPDLDVYDQVDRIEQRVIDLSQFH